MGQFLDVTLKFDIIFLTFLYPHFNYDLSFSFSSACHMVVVNDFVCVHFLRLIYHKFMLQ